MMDIDVVENPTREWFLENPKGRLMKTFAKNSLPNFYNQISIYPGSKFSEKVYNYFENNAEIPKCKCGAVLHFRSFTMGYSKNCSQACSYKNDSRSQQYKSTMFKRYGVDNISKLESIKDKKKQSVIEHYGGYKPILEKTSNTIQQRYGVDNISKLESIKDKKKQSVIEHYGGYEEIINKTKQTCLKKYGVECIFNRSDIREKSRLNFYNKFLQENPLIISIDNNEYVCKCPHPTCNKCVEKQFKISNIAYNNRKYSDSELCTNLSPENLNKYSNTTLEIFIKQLLDKYDISYIENDRIMLSGQELDIYIPDKKIAIECNGVYWHSCLFKDKQYHYNKYKKCLELGIQLITVWEDQILKYPNKIKNILLSKLGIHSVRIYARKCKVQIVNPAECINFLNENHLQNYAQSSVNIGLYYDNILLSIMTFSKRKIFDKQGDWELIRYCCKEDVQIIGGAKKLLSYFIKTYNPSTITSFSSNDISTGDLYKKLGFDYISDSLSYWYIDGKFNRYHRYKFRKSELIKMGYDKNKTEFEITNDMKLIRIYDTGQSKWIKYIK